MSFRCFSCETWVLEDICIYEEVIASVHQSLFGFSVMMRDRKTKNIKIFRFRTLSFESP